MTAGCDSAEYKFTAHSSKGALLILPHGATFHDARPKSQFRELAIQNAVHWYSFATQTRRREISNHSMYLITGFYKARSWSLASFQDALPGAGGSLRAVKVAESSDPGNYEWTSTFPMDWKYGPRHYPGNENQTIFLRGYKIAIRNDIHKARTEQPVVEAIPHHNAPVDAQITCLSFLRSPFHRRKQRDRNHYYPVAVRDLVDAIHAPRLSQVGGSSMTADAMTRSFASLSTIPM